MKKNQIKQKIEEAESKINRGIDYANGNTVWEGIAQLQSLERRIWFNKGKVKALKEVLENYNKIGLIPRDMEIFKHWLKDSLELT